MLAFLDDSKNYRLNISNLFCVIWLSCVMFNNNERGEY